MEIAMGNGPYCWIAEEQQATWNHGSRALFIAEKRYGK